MKEKIIFLICGRARNGKDTFSNILKEELESKYNKKVCIIGLMRTLKGYIKDYFGWDGKEETKPRELLQKFGTDIIREKLNKNYFHIDRLCEDISVLDEFFNVFIIDDVRFPLEIETLKERFDKVIVINIYKDNAISNMTDEEKSHISENALNEYTDYDYVINNNGTINDLELNVKKIIEEVF